MLMLMFMFIRFSNSESSVNVYVSQVSSIAVDLGIMFCLNAAANLSHRARAIASSASKWHVSEPAESKSYSNQRHALGKYQFKLNARQW